MKLRPVAVGSGLHVGLLSPNRRGMLRLPHSGLRRLSPGQPPRGICAFVVGHPSFHGFLAICLTRRQPRTGFAGKVG